MQKGDDEWRAQKYRSITVPHHIPESTIRYGVCIYKYVEENEKKISPMLRIFLVYCAYTYSTYNTKIIANDADVEILASIISVLHRLASRSEINHTINSVQIVVVFL